PPEAAGALPLDIPPLGAFGASGWLGLPPQAAGARAPGVPPLGAFWAVAHPGRPCRPRPSASEPATTLAEVFLTKFQKPSGAPDVDLNSPVEPTYQPLAILRPGVRPSDDPVLADVKPPGHLLDR